jgi:4-carboxymuconolactone decarboxylase
VTAESFKDGLKIQKEMMGDEFPQRAIDNTTPLTRPYQELLIGFTFGEVWKRDVLSRAERSLVTLSFLIALNRPDQMRTHIRAALNNGVPKEKIFELAIHALAYLGAPLAGTARNTIVEEFQKLGLEPPAAQPAAMPSVKK